MSVQMLLESTNSFLTNDLSSLKYRDNSHPFAISNSFGIYMYITISASLISNNCSLDTQKVRSFYDALWTLLIIEIRKCL